MITFRQYLTESRSAPLYHGTPISNGLKILETGRFETDTVHAPERLLKTEKAPFVRGLSTTRNFKFATEWSRRETDKDSYLVFEFDQQKLTYNYEIKPIQFWSKLGARQQEITKGTLKRPNEYEEFIVSNKPIPLKYVTKIHYNIDLHQHPNMQKSIDIVMELTAKLRKFRKKYPHIKFVGEALD